MGLADIGKTVAGGMASLAGDLPKAVLFLRKYQPNMLWTEQQLREAEKNADEAVFNKLVAEGDMDLGGFFEDGQENLLGMGEGVTKAMDMWKMNFLDSPLSNAANALEGNPASGNGTQSFAALKQIANANGLVAMEVQYNPSSISLQTAQGRREVNDGGMDNLVNSQIRQFTSKAVTNLSFQLVFDAMNQMDAFMLDASMLSAGGALSLGMDIANNIGENAEGFTVRTQVEGLIASLFSPATRRVVFCWSGMIFKGDMLQVNANYTMFNKIGNPIRATVDVTIQQNTESEKNELNGHWNKAFTKVFGQQGFNTMSGAASTMDKVMNNPLLNFSL